MMNTINLIGNLGSAPEFKVFPSGKRLARFSLAVNKYRKKTGNPEIDKNNAMWIECELWDAAVERLQKCSVRKGTSIAVTGSLAMNEYLSTIGNEQQKKRKHFVKVSSFQVLSAREELPAEPSQDDDAFGSNGDDDIENVA